MKVFGNGPAGAFEQDVAWLRNLDRKPWSLEIPYEHAGRAKPMFPDMLIVRRTGDEFRFDILEPYDPSLADNLEKAKGLAQFAEKHGDVYERIQLIRVTKGSVVRLEMNRSQVRDRIKLVTLNDQIDALFEELGSC